MRLTEPSWVTIILEWRWTQICAWIDLTSAYWVGAATKPSNFAGAIVEQNRFGLHPGWLWASLAITVELIGSLLVISGQFVRLGAGALGVLTVVVAVAANNFWDRKIPSALWRSIYFSSPSA
ncbi:DoxX family protein [Mesorhizobium sp. B2-4-17]|uniref:DoxX family protein n=1 Tax=Mesorhizobium sp. B2-4-17 TaxID=2589932 RepID=UPI001FEDA864|nr:DoxX family protein [Mesorhizobium sp. B2-4-17]